MWVTPPPKMELPTQMLTNAVISGSKPREKPFKLADGGGLYLLVMPVGRRWWRLRFRVRGKEQMLSLGVFPDVSLKEARERRDQARRDLAKGINPSAKRRTEKLASGDTFEAIAREWFEKFSPTWVDGYSSKVIRRLGPARRRVERAVERHGSLSIRDVAHFALGPERIIVTPNLQEVLADYVPVPAAEQLCYSPHPPSVLDRVIVNSRALRVILPPSGRHVVHVRVRP